MKHSSWPGLTVALHGADNELAEYAVEDEGEQGAPSPTGYVECAAGMVFSVCVQRGNRFKYKDECLKARIYVDGKFMRSKTSQTSDAKVEAEGMHYRPEDLKKLGTITVSLVRCVHEGRTPAQAVDSSPAVLAREFVPEKGLKGRAISNAVTLAKGERTRQDVHTTQVEYPYGKTPFLTFNLKYRSRRDLQIEGIIPRTPSPEPLEERDPDTLTLEEAREIARRHIAHHKVVKSEVKREKRDHASFVQDDPADDGDGDEAEVSIQSERSKRARTSLGPGVEVMDLSED